MPEIERRQPVSTRAALISLGLALLCSILINASGRGIMHDEVLGTYRGAADLVFAGQPLMNLEQPDAPPEQAKNPARLIYILLIALSYHLFGKTLLALHFFPYLLQALNPCLFFFIALRFFRNVGWAVIAATLFLIQPFNLAFLNLPDTVPVFFFWLLLLILVFDAARRQPKWLLAAGALTSLLILTRFDDGVIFGGLLYGMYLVYRWKPGIPWKWLLGSIGLFVATHVVFASLFGFPVFYPLHYLPFLLQRQATYGADFSFIELTRLALRIFLYWFLGGKFAAPLVLICLVVGTIAHLQRREFHPLALFAPYAGFTLFVYNGRFDAANLPGLALLSPGFLLILVSGIQAIAAFFARRVTRAAGVQNTTRWRLTPSTLQRIVSGVILIALIGAFSRSAYALLILIEDSMPISTLWHIVKANPPLPGHPAYQEALIRLSPDKQMPVLLREQLIKAVRGQYRSWYLHRIGQDAFEQELIEQAKTTADFFYTDDYETPTQWERDRYALEGSSPLWSDQHPGLIGAFPSGKSGTFTYKFDFPAPIRTVTLADVHTQWGFHDATKMWTSTDGEQWTLRHHNWNVHFQKDPYYQFFEDEFAGQTSLWIKYELKADDPTRADHDNRGASLQEFYLAVTYAR